MSKMLGPDAITIIRALGRRSLSRAELVEATGWSRNTVATRLSALVQSQWVVESEEAQGERGRPYTRYRLNPRAALVYVANFGWDQLSGAVCTLQGEVLAAETVGFELGTGLHQAIDLTGELMNKLAAHESVNGARTAAAVVGVPSPVANPAMLPSWRRIDQVTRNFSDHLGIPVTIENDANLMAIGSSRYDHPDAQSLVFVKVATGIGAGLILSGRPHRGLRGLAGEIGHIPVSRAAGRACACGNNGCLSEIASVPALLRDFSRAHRPVDSLGDLEALVGSGDAAAVMTLRQAGRDIGEALVGVATGLAPDLIVVGGHIARIGDHLTTGIREALYSRTLPAMSSQIRVESTPNHQQTGHRGAAELAFEKLFPAAVKLGVKRRPAASRAAA